MSPVVIRRARSSDWMILSHGTSRFAAMQCCIEGSIFALFYLSNNWTVQGRDDQTLVGGPKEA
jgi:hypothetical protein